jgi:peptidylprolyl isomerase
MTNYRDIIIAFLGTAVVIGLLASFVSYRSGEQDRLADAEKYSDVEVPLAPTNEDAIEENTSSTNASTSPITKPPMPTQNPMVTFVTNKGDITFELFLDTMPVTVGNFMKLAESGFYDTTKFHRVIQGFMIQGGDPNSKGSDTSTYGRGGPGYTIKDEFAPGLSNARGTIAMANAGPNTGGSQFFINLVPNTYLDPKHPVFGKVVAGMDIVDQIALVAKDARDVPVEPVILEKVAVKK